MNNKHRKILEAIFARPVRPGIKWADIEGLLIGLGAEVEEAQGSRITVSLNGVDAVFHRPHPQPTTDKGALMSVRRFLVNAGVMDDESAKV
jgi:hypothetical protein